MMFIQWITYALKRITVAHKEGRLFGNQKGFALLDGETSEQGFERLEGELATAKEGSGKGFYDSLSPDIKSNPSMMKFEKASHEDIAKSYINLQGKISAKGITIPGKNASEDEINAFRKELGRPDKAEEYQIAIPKDLHQNIVSNAESQKVFKEQCYKLGLNSEQTQGLHEWYMTELSNVLKQEDEADKKSSDEAMTALSSRWGTMKDAKIALAVKVVNKFGGEKAQEFLDKGLGNDPAMLEMFAKIGESVSEDSLGVGGKSQYGGLTPDAAQAKIDEIRNNPKSAYNDGSSPTHKEAVAEMTALYQIVTSGENK